MEHQNISTAVRPPTHKIITSQPKLSLSLSLCVSPPLRWHRRTYAVIREKARAALGLIKISPNVTHERTNERSIVFRIAHSLYELPATRSVFHRNHRRCPPQEGGAVPLSILVLVFIGCYFSTPCPAGLPTQHSTPHRHSLAFCLWQSPPVNAPPPSGHSLSKRRLIRSIRKP